ncbi:hypothetical protein TNIN_439521 [Trichonephila inaurata madagascariensis]|uniref:Uncharacterized protein n=1 Tax=Trichonephila inaurata madagascariensis TaxID=2747483 RepID=A0A8X6YCX1_9ARAC|nr:hypothetical protein TNIN_439521 [Trichonephila inaurata madagascariensis]
MLLTRALRFTKSLRCECGIRGVPAMSNEFEIMVPQKSPRVASCEDRPLATAGSVDTNGTLRCRGSGVFAQPLESPGWPWAVMLLEFGRSLFAG